MNLIDGSYTGKSLQVGSLSGQNIEISIANMNATSLFGGTNATVSAVSDVNTQNLKSYNSSLTVSSFETAGSAMKTIQSAIALVSNQRSDIGAVQNRLEHTIANLDNISENTQSAESRIRDTDMASEMVEFSKHNILAQAGQSMLAQANQSTQGVLSLLQ